MKTPKHTQVRPDSIVGLCGSASCTQSCKYKSHPYTRLVPLYAKPLHWRIAIDILKASPPQGVQVLRTPTEGRNPPNNQGLTSIAEMEGSVISRIPIFSPKSPARSVHICIYTYTLDMYTFVCHRDSILRTGRRENEDRKCPHGSEQVR